VWFVMLIHQPPPVNLHGVPLMSGQNMF
jgi:hypothetical protein